jgi:hypothetical protein
MVMVSLGFCRVGPWRLRLDAFGVRHVDRRAGERHLAGDAQPSASTAWLNGATGSGTPAIMWNCSVMLLSPQ